MKNSTSYTLYSKFLLVSCLLFLVSASVCRADYSYSVMPAIKDYKGPKRDIIKDVLIIKNNTGARLSLYTFVDNVTAERGREERIDGDPDIFAQSLAHWISISRAEIELGPFEEKKLDFQIQINMRAKPGIYHAVISFAPGSRRSEAEALLDKGVPVLALNVEVEDDTKEKLQLKQLSSKGSALAGSAVRIAYEVENVGNSAEAPRGEIRIYNRSGGEVASIPVAADSVIAPGTTALLASVWDANKNFGRYKAVLDLEYGSKRVGTLQDTVFFWVLPWKKILPAALIWLVGMGLAGFYLHKRYKAAPRYARVASSAARMPSSPPRHIPPDATSLQPQRPTGHVVDLRNRGKKDDE